MKKLLMVLLVGLFGVVVFGIGVGPVLDNWVLPYYDEYEDVSGALVFSFAGLRLAVGPIDLGISTPFYVYATSDDVERENRFNPGRHGLYTVA